MKASQIAKAKDVIAILFKGMGCLVLLFVIVSCMFILIMLLAGPDPYPYGSLYICNRSGLDVQFEELTVENTLIWGGPEFVASTELQKRSNAGDAGACRFFTFHAPRKAVQLSLTTMNELQEKEVVTCILDNTQGPRHYWVWYHNGGLACCDGGPFSD